NPVANKQAAGPDTSSVGAQDAGRKESGSTPLPPAPQNAASAPGGAESPPPAQGAMVIDTLIPEQGDLLADFVGQTFKAPSGRLKEVTLKFRPSIGSVADMKVRVLVSAIVGTWPKLK